LCHTRLFVDHFKVTHRKLKWMMIETIVDTMICVFRSMCAEDFA
jgi:hypothetical protein